MIAFIVVYTKNEKRNHYINVDHIVDICRNVTDEYTTITTTNDTTFFTSDSPDEIIKKINDAKLGIKYE